MKLFVCLVAILLVPDSFSEPLLGIRRTRKLCRVGSCVGGGILGTILGGGGYNSQQIQTRRDPAPAPAPAPAASPTVNVNVQNVYNNQNNKQETHNNMIGAVNNNVVTNKLDYKQDIKNRAESNVYNKEQVNNRLVNNNYAEAPSQQPCEGGCEPAPRYYQY